MKSVKRKTKNRKKMNEETNKEMNKEEEEEEAPTTCMTLLTSTVLKICILSLTILLVGGTVGILFLYYLENKEVTDLLQAVSAIRNVLTGQNKTNPGKSDVEILFEARQQSYILIEIKKNYARMTREINKVIELVNQGWKPHKEALYLFSGRSGISHVRAKEDCEKRNAFLAVVIDDDEQKFIDENVIHAEKNFWIALHKVGDNWEWITGEKPSKTYWAAGEPKTPRQRGPLCAEVRGLCITKLKCWYVNLCREGSGWICKMKPDPNYLD